MTTAEAEAFLDDLAEMGAPVLLFSGGEPVLRPDLFHLGAYAASAGRAAGAVHERHADYTGGVADQPKGPVPVRRRFHRGRWETQDRFRAAGGGTPRPGRGCAPGAGGGTAHGGAVHGLAGKRGGFAGRAQQCVEEGVTRFCLYHLVYAGRGAELAARDLTAERRRAMVAWLAGQTEELARAA